MTITLWIVQCLLGLIFIITGCFKLFQSKEKVIASGGAWAENFSPAVIKIISGCELISGFLVIAGRLLGNSHNLSFIGGSCISIIMAGSIFTHIRRKEYKHAGINAVFLLMALFVAFTVRPASL